MLARRRHVALLLLALVLAGCIQNRRHTPDAVLGLDETSATVSVGADIDIELPEHRSAGDSWRLVEAPDPDLLHATENGYGPDDLGAWDDGGTRSFSYRAEQPGDAALTFYNCYRCAADGTSSEPEMAAEVTFHITIEAG